MQHHCSSRPVCQTMGYTRWNLIYGRTRPQHPAWSCMNMSPIVVISYYQLSWDDNLWSVHRAKPPCSCLLPAKHAVLEVGLVKVWPAGLDLAVLAWQCWKRVCSSRRVAVSLKYQNLLKLARAGMCSCKAIESFDDRNNGLKWWQNLAIGTVCLGCFKRFRPLGQGDPDHILQELLWGKAGLSHRLGLIASYIYI